MLYPPEPVADRLRAVQQKLAAGELSAVEAAEALLVADPEYAPAYVMLGAVKMEAGRLEEAETLIWRGLDIHPCEPMSYLSLAHLRRKVDPKDLLAERLFELGLWKLSFLETIPGALVDQFRDQDTDSTLELEDPETYAVMAHVKEIERQKQTDPEAVVERLRPYKLLNDLQRQAGSVVDGELIDEYKAHASVCVPVFHQALRGIARWDDGGNDETACLLAALLGEAAGPEVLADLLDFAVSDIPGAFEHGNWAAWRLGQRFPAGALSALRAAIPGSTLPMRCAIAEHLAMLPKEADPIPALLETLDGIGKSPDKRKDTVHLLAGVADALERLGHPELVRSSVEPIVKELPSGARKTFRSELRNYVSELEMAEIEGLTIEDICLERVYLGDDEEDLDDEEQDFDDEETEFEQPRPVRPGRNDPCWCGSGKKYKKCHLAADEEDERRQNVHQEEEDDEIFPAEGGERGDPDMARLIRDIVATGMERGSDVRRASEIYFGDAGLAGRDEIEGSGFIEWYVHDYRSPSTGRTAVEEYLWRNGPRLNARERGIVESMRDNRFGLYEVQRVEEGAGLELKDVFSGEQFFVHEVSASRELVKWDCILGRVEVFEGRHAFSGNGQVVPRTLLPAFLDQIDAERRNTEQSAADFIRANSHRVRGILEKLSEKQFNELKLVNAEGDPIELCAAIYDVRDEAATLAALRQRTELQEDTVEEGAGISFGWMEAAGPESRRVYGHVKINEGRLRLECNSRRRLELGRRLIDGCAGAFLRHRADSFKSAESLKAEARSRAAGKPEREDTGIPREVEQKLLLEYKRKHYENWPDERLPALGGKTPREAVRTPKGRRLVEDLLRDFENGEARGAKQRGAAFDFGPIRKALGLES